MRSVLTNDSLKSEIKLRKKVTITSLMIRHSSSCLKRLKKCISILVR